MIFNKYLILVTACFFLLFTACTGLRQEDNPAERVFKIRNLNQLATLEADIVKVLSASDDATWFKLGSRKSLFSCEAKIKAGIDLSKLKEADIRIENNNVTMSIPSAEVFILKINPGAIKEVYTDVGILRSDFSTAEKELIFQMGQKKVEESIPELGILKQAEQNAVVFLTAYLKAAGFKQIQILTQPY